MNISIGFEIKYSISATYIRIWTIIAICCCDYFVSLSSSRDWIQTNYYCQNIDPENILNGRNENQDDILKIFFPVMKSFRHMKEILVFKHCLDIWFSGLWYIVWTQMMMNIHRFYWTWNQLNLSFYQFTITSKEKYHQKNIVSNLKLDIHSCHKEYFFGCYSLVGFVFGFNPCD